jgi:ferredoxin
VPTITIEERGCRDCNLCIEICPTEVLEREASTGIAKVVRKDDCIGCTSCMYICPSGCLTVTEYEGQRPFHRIEKNAALVARFLQQQPVAVAVTDADQEEALRDVRVRLQALADAVTETMGRGQKAVGRAAGGLSAGHLPEMYEATDLPSLLDHLGKRFAHSFGFDAQVVPGDNGVILKFQGCALRKIVEGHAEKIGNAVLCTLLHEYLCGLVTAFTGKNYTVDTIETGASCALKLQLRAQ